MATVQVELKSGLIIGETAHKLAVIRELTAGDLIDATDESEKLVATPDNGYQLVASPTLMGLHSLRRQVVRIGDHQGPLTLGELRKLSGHDLSLLQETANRLDAATLQGVEDAGKKQ